MSALVGGPQEVTIENAAQHVSNLHAMDILRTNRVRRRAEETVNDPETAKLLESLNDTGDLTTLHGVASHGFPNLFWPGPLQGGATANQSFVLERLSEHVAYVMARAAAKTDGGRPVIEPGVEAQEEWAALIMSKAASFAAMRGCTPGYYNLEGENDKIAAMPPEAQMKAARNAIWGDGFLSYLKVLEDWRAEGNLRGLHVISAS
ncbi:hypothetical protein KC345_g1996 [Hortaea werneckii]|nr:hypothetical protein KC345_g1996 [Hortaea werneckii]